MLLMIYKRKNDIGYSDAKFCFKIEMEAWITALSIRNISASYDYKSD